MRNRPLILISLFLGLMLLALLLVERSPSYATGLQTTTVQGLVLLPNSDPAFDARVWIAPQDAEGQIDYSRLLSTTSGQLGEFAFTNVPVGVYALDISPFSVATALWYTRVITITAAPLNLGNITLPAAPKRIEGSVQRASVPLVGEHIWAYNAGIGRWVEAHTDTNGRFELGVSGGAWSVEVEQAPGANWMFVERPARVQFAEDNSAETASIVLTVQSTNGAIEGRLLDPNGAPLLPPSYPIGGINPAAVVSVYNAGGPGWNWDNLGSTGAFTIPVVAGRYFVAPWLDATVYPDYAVPPLPVQRVNPNQPVDLGDIRVLRRNAEIAGTVRAPDNAQISGAEVFAYQFDGDETASATTDGAGAYRLKVTPGEWIVDVAPPFGSAYLNRGDSAQEITAIADTTVPLDFTLAPAALRITGAVVDQQGLPITDLFAWAYVRSADSSALISVEPVWFGTFSIMAPAGDLRVGLLLPSGSRYSFLNEVDPAAIGQARADGQLALETRSVRLALARNDVRLQGTLRDQNGHPVADISGEALAAPIAAPTNWQAVNLNSDGSFALDLAAGLWYLSYDLDTDQYLANPPAPILITAASGQTITQDLVTRRLDGALTGQLLDENDQPVPDALIWVEGATIGELFTSTDDEGIFTFAVPLNAGDAPATYTLGTSFVCTDGGSCLLNIDPQTVTATLRTLLGAGGAGPQSISIGLRARSGAQVRVSGAVSSVTSGVRVTARPNGGTAGSDSTGANGAYSLTFSVASVSATSVSGSISGSGGGFYASSSFSLGLSAAQINAALQAGEPIQVTGPTLELRKVVEPPRTETHTFAAAQGWSYTMPDGMQIQIPPAATPTATTVRVVIAPTFDLPFTAAYEAATFYGYNISLFDAANGRPINELNTPALITLRYDQRHLELRNTRETAIVPANVTGGAWQPATSYVQTTATNRITFQTRMLGTWALARPQTAQPEYSAYLTFIQR